MPSWKKVITSGSDAALNSLLVSNGITGSLLGTASTASFVTGSNVYGPYGSNSVISSSYALTASYATYAANGGVTKIIAGANVNLSPVSGLGDVTVTSFGTNLYNTATGSYGSFYDTGSVLATSATAIYSMSISTTDISNGVFVSASGGDNTRVKFTNAGTYNVQFSSQFSNSDNANQDVVIWIRKNGTDIPDSSGTVGVPPFKAGSNGQVIASWNYYLSLSAGDFIQMCWHVEQANVITLETIAAGTSPAHPRTPSLIVTANRVDQFLSNTGSFSGSFTGTLTGTASFATTANATTAALTAGTFLTSAGTFNGSTARTFAVDATDANTASKVVARDASGNFSAGRITIAGLTLTGSAVVTGSLLVGDGLGTVLDTANYTLVDGGVNSVDWGNRVLKDTNNVATVDWENLTLTSPSGPITKVDWGSGYTKDSADKFSIDWQTRQLLDTTANPAVDWSARRLYNSANANVLDWEAGTFTGSLQGTSSYATQALSASFANTAATASYVTGSIFTNGNRALSASFALTSSYVNTLNQAVTINGPLTVASTSSAAQPYNVLFSKNISGSTGAYNSTTTNTLTVTATTSSGYQTAALKNTLGIATNASYNYTFGHEWSAMTNELTIGSYGSIPYAADATNTLINTTNRYTRTIGTLYDMKFGYFNYGTVSTHYGIYHDASDARHYFAGNIGIGTTSPSAKLHIVAPGALSTDLAFKVRNSANTGDLLLVTGNGGTQVGVGGLSIPRTDTPNGSLLSTITYATNGLTRFSTAIETPGGLYGSTTTDTSILALSLGFYGIGLRCYGGSTTTGFTFNTIVTTTGTYWMRMQNGATDLFTILTSGSIGISNSAPKYKLDVSGSTRISGETNTSISSSLVVYGSGSAQPVFTVQGSQGELFSITDSLSGSLFSVNDISGLPIMEVFSDNTTLMGSYVAPSLNTTVKTTTIVGNNVIYSIPTASYNGAWFEYVATSASNARAGQIMSVCSSNTITYTETTTTDIGSTTGLNFRVMITGSNFALTGSSTTAGWTIKTIVRGI
jgi:hypothetical protein